ncbi:hypothetical protein K7957_11765 [Sphingomonas yunnanensis]|uniref:hypothetical protein n=1 Tax=Sphingomonas yunnanensis TaxID=310400 RepID=UPI001CA65008|nr:hypothetical protein [Sphingomonas yunnanensis]MBY9063610.1 hypothetical protein [Sphingomonas yunnanensis]
MPRLFPLYPWAPPLLLVGALAAAPAAAQTAATPFATAALDEGALAQIAGREDTRQSALAEQNAGVSHNSVGDNVRTGDATIDGQAFQNMSGLSVLSVNTGNNVAINAAMNVTIALSPTP